MYEPHSTAQTSQKWRMTIEYSPVAMALASPRGELSSANLALCAMLGYPVAGRESLTFQQIVHVDDVDIDNQLRIDMLTGRLNSYRINKRYRHSDGSTLYGNLSVTLLRDEQGLPVHFTLQIVDLTEQLAFASQLESVQDQVDAERARAEAVFDSVDVGLLLLDATGAPQRNNTPAMGFAELVFPAGATGQAGQLGEIFVADQSRKLTRDELPTTRANRGEEFSNFVVWVGTEPAARRALSVSARSVRDRLGHFTGSALAHHDVTDMMRAMAVRDEIVASVSHELRTPPHLCAGLP